MPPAPTTTSLPLTCACSVPSLHDHHFFVGMRVRRVRGGVRIQRGDVHLELIERARGLTNHGSQLAHVGLLRGEVAPFPRGGIQQLAGSSASETQAKVTLAAMAAVARSRLVIMGSPPRSDAQPTKRLSLATIRAASYLRSRHVGSKLEAVIEKALFCFALDPCADFPRTVARSDGARHQVLPGGLSPHSAES